MDCIRLTCNNYITYVSFLSIENPKGRLIFFLKCSKKGLDINFLFSYSL